MRFRATALLLAGGFSAALAAQPQPQPQPGPAPGPQMVRRMRPPPPPHFTGENAQLPMTFEQGIPVVQVSVNGEGPYRFAIDTGAAGHGRIRASVAEALGLSVTGEMLAGDGSGRSQARKNFGADTLAVGGVTFSGVQLSEMPMLPGRLEKVDGILGFHLFSSHLLTLDYAGGRFRLEKGSLPADSVSFEPGRAPITISLSVGGAAVPAHIDTGNVVAPLILPSAFVERLPKSGEPRRAGVARTAVSTIDMWEVDIAAPVRIGGLTVPITSVRYPALGESGNLGSLALRSAVLRIDPANRRLDLRFAGQGDQK